MSFVQFMVANMVTDFLTLHRRTVRIFHFAVMLALALLVWLPQIGEAIADPNATPTPTPNGATTKIIPSGAIGVLYDPDPRYRRRDPHGIHDGDQGFLVLIGPSDRVRYARVLIHVTYSDDIRHAAYDVGPSAGGTLVWASSVLDEWWARRVRVDLNGRDIAQLGSTCWLGPICCVHSPIAVLRPEEPAHALIDVGLRPMSVVYSRGTHSLELQCDYRNEKLESDIADLLSALRLTW